MSPSNQSSLGRIGVPRILNGMKHQRIQRIQVFYIRNGSITTKIWLFGWLLSIWDNIHMDDIWYRKWNLNNHLILRGLQGFFLHMFDFWCLRRAFIANPVVGSLQPHLARFHVQLKVPTETCLLGPPKSSFFPRTKKNHFFFGMHKARRPQDILICFEFFGMPQKSQVFFKQSLRKKTTKLPQDPTQPRPDSWPIQPNRAKRIRGSAAGFWKWFILYDPKRQAQVESWKFGGGIYCLFQGGGWDGESWGDLEIWRWWELEVTFFLELTPLIKRWVRG